MKTIRNFEAELQRKLIVLVEEENTLKEKIKNFGKTKEVVAE